MLRPAKPLLADPFYYLHNFAAMLETLRARDGDLLTVPEREFIEGFAGLPRGAQALLVRMVMRKGVLFRASRLRYPEIAPITDAVAPLVAVSWVDDRPRLSLEELFALLPKAELVRELALPPQLTAKPKSTLLERAREASPGHREFKEWCPGLSDRVYRLTVDELCDRLRLMFFGNFRQTLTEFVLADLGIFKFETTPLHLTSRPFRTRRHVDAFLELHRCRDLFRQGGDLGEVERTLPAPIRDCGWLEDRREKLRLQIARAHERAGSRQAALKIYLDCTHREATRRAERLRSKLSGITQTRTPRRSANPPEFTLALGRPVTQMSVESLVRLHLESSTHEDTCVYYVENALINSLFGLLCWRAVFAPVQGAFFHMFHHGPADLGNAAFHSRRARQFEDCLAELRCGSYKDTIRRYFVEKSGVSSPFVAWGLLDERLLETALTCFPAEHLAHWFDWILQDVTVNRCGFPDLVQFWPRSARYRLIEIKGPGDRLQDNQRRCLDHCLSKGMPVSVCRVRWLAAAKPA